MSTIPKCGQLLCGFMISKRFTISIQRDIKNSHFPRTFVSHPLVISLASNIQCFWVPWGRPNCTPFILITSRNLACFITSLYSCGRGNWLRRHLNFLLWIHNHPPDWNSFCSFLYCNHESWQPKERVSQVPVFNFTGNSKQAIQYGMKFTHTRLILIHAGYFSY